MKTTTLTQNTQEKIVREYLDAFSCGDVNAMLRHIHPAIHYERYIADQAETIDNGAQHFREFLERSAVGLDEQSLELLRVKTDADQVLVDFRIVTSEPYHANHQPMKGNAVFWFMEDQISIRSVSSAWRLLSDCCFSVACPHSYKPLVIKKGLGAMKPM